MQGIKTHQWCQKFKIDFDLKGVNEFFRERMVSTPAMSRKDYALLAQKSSYWDWFTRDIANTEVIGLLDYIQAKHKLPVKTENTKIALWEYGEGDELPPHVDVAVSLSSSIVVSLSGRFETRLNDSDDPSKVLDVVTYGPGEYIILNNTVYCHSGRPLDSYRLAVVLFVDPSFDMKSFWS